MKYLDEKFGNANPSFGFQDERRFMKLAHEPGGTCQADAKPKLFYQFVKRIIDVFGAVGMAVIFLPAFVIIPVLIRKDGGGAVFRQERIGMYGRKFHVYKFRTMVIDAENNLNQVLAKCPARQKEWNESRKLFVDPRVTRVGAFLRKTSLDELPQLINVLKGEMSLVGPRPIVMSEVHKYGKWFIYYSSVKPGITGLWQVRGRNDVTYLRRVALDRRYARSQSIWLDIYLLAITPYAMIRRSGY